jgi:hypothetical protein
MMVSIILFGLSRSFLALVLRYSITRLYLARRRVSMFRLQLSSLFSSQAAAYTAR